MVPKPNNFAFIDAANLHNGVSASGWKLDYAKFRIWLREKHGVASALIFIGYVKANEGMYARMRQAGFELVFKETVRDGSGNIKGNCDADLVLWTVRGAYENQYERAVIISSDGDYTSTIKFLQARGKCKCVISPSDKCSILLMRTGVPITYIRDIRQHVESAQK